MTDIAKLQTAIDYLLSEFGPHDPEWPEFEPIYDAARELLTLREAGALIITPDEDGTCSMPLWNLGMEAREVEPQPCGMPGEFNLEDQVYCHQCIGDALRDAMSDGET